MNDEEQEALVMTILMALWLVPLLWLLITYSLAQEQRVVPFILTDNQDHNTTRLCEGRRCCDIRIYSDGHRHPTQDCIWKPTEGT